MGSKNRITLLKRSRAKNSLCNKTKTKRSKSVTMTTTWGQTKPNYYDKGSVASVVTIILPILFYLLAVNLGAGSVDDPNSELMVKLLVSCDTTKNQHSSFMWEQILRN